MKKNKYLYAIAGAVAGIALLYAYSWYANKKKAPVTAGGTTGATTPANTGTTVPQMLFSGPVYR